MVTLTNPHEALTKASAVRPTHNPYEAKRQCGELDTLGECQPPGFFHIVGNDIFWH